MPGDYEYVATLDISQIQRELKRVGALFNKFEKQADTSFQGIDNGARSSGLAIGATAGVVGALTSKLLELGAAAGAAFSQLVIDSVGLASQAESVEQSFINIFDGNREAADAFQQRLDNLALDLGVKSSALSGLAKSILPDTESVEQFERLATAAVTLDKADPEKTLDDARAAIEEALSGDFTSLRERFDLPKSTIENIKDLQKELGPVEGLVKGLEDEFARTGQNLESFADTGQAGFDRLTARFDALKTLFGEPILEAAKVEMSDFEQFLIDNQDELRLLAGALGDVVAEIVSFVGSGLNDFLGDLDTSRLLAAADQLFDLVKIGETFLSLAFQWIKTVGEFFSRLSIGQQIISAVGDRMGSLNDILIGGLDFLAKSKAGYEGLIAVLKPTTDAIAAIAQALVDLAFGDFEAAARSAGDALKAVENGVIDMKAGQDAANRSYAESRRQLDELRTSLNENNQAMDERREKLHEDTSAGLEQADALLQQAAADREAEEAAEALAEAQAKVKEAFDKQDTAEARAELDALIESERKATAAAVDAARERESIALKNAQAIEDIQRKSDQAVADAGTDLSRDEQDIARDQANEQIDIARQSAQKRLDVETQFRRRLQDIQRQFAKSALEAERTRDAEVFLRARDERDTAIADATIERDRSLTDVGTETSRAQEQAKIDAQRAREEAQIENERKLQDLQTQLERELEAQEIANQRELEQQAIKEEQKRQDLAVAEEQAAADRATANERKRADLEASLAEELELIKKAEAEKSSISEQELARFRQIEAEKTRIELAESEKRIAQIKKEAAARLQAQGRAGAGSIRPSAPGLAGLAGGGSVVPGQTYLVGEKGPELFSSNVPGRIIPNRSVQSVPTPLGAHISNTDNSLRATAQIDLVDPTRLSPEQRAIIGNIFEERLTSVLQRSRRAGAR